MKNTRVKIPRKLIEVALPLDSINKACVREKSLRHGHPSTLHLYWARRPLAAARAVLFAQLVNDPGYENHDGLRRGVNKKEAAKERERLFKIIEDLVIWENSNNKEVLAKARYEIMKSWRETCELNKDHPEVAELFNPDKLPAFHDLFAGGGAIPLEAQRLGLKSYASDLNPVAVLINKAMIEIPPKFRDHKPVHATDGEVGLTLEDSWIGATGIAEDVRYYGQWMRSKALERIGIFYHMFIFSREMFLKRPDLEPFIGEEMTVMAWLWARTIKSPSPAFSHVDIPLISSFVLSAKEGKEAYIEPEIEGDKYRFTVKTGPVPSRARSGSSLAKRSVFRCLLSFTAIYYDYIRRYGTEFGFGSKLMAVVLEGPDGRVFLSPGDEQELKYTEEVPELPSLPLSSNTRDFRTPLYGIKNFDELFSSRQKLALSTFSDLISEVKKRIFNDAVRSGMPDDGVSLENGGKGALAYSESVATYLAFVIDKCADYWSTVCSWDASRGAMRQTFGRQAIPMTWDFAETNPFSNSSGNWMSMLNWTEKALANFPASSDGVVLQADAQTQTISKDKVISTDPPYYDNIGYADLSDFFYIWMRKNLREIYPLLFSTIATPKKEELIASPHRHSSSQEAEKFFLDGMTEAMSGLARQAHPAFPVTIYYAFKQSETKSEGTVSTGWVAFLEAVLRAGFSITGTWPMRTELPNRSVGIGTNALASSVVLVCRKKSLNAPTITRREFQRELNTVLPEALEEMTQGGKHSAIAPVDMSQAIIGPGIGIFSKYQAVLEADGSPMSVKTALQLINRFLAEDAFDLETQFCLTWFESHQWKESTFGEADLLARAKGISVDKLKDAGVLASEKGKARLYRWGDYPTNWDASSDNNTPIWEALHHLLRALNSGGEEEAATVLSSVPKKEAGVRVLCYRLYSLCERKGWSEDARFYNELIASWEAIKSRLTNDSAISESFEFDF